MASPVIVEAIRTPIEKRGGWLAGLKRQAGEQGRHVGRHAWLYGGLLEQAGVTTIDVQCGSGQQAVQLAAALIHAGVVDAAIERV